MGGRFPPRRCAAHCRLHLCTISGWRTFPLKLAIRKPHELLVSASYAAHHLPRCAEQRDGSLHDRLHFHLQFGNGAADIREA